METVGITLFVIAELFMTLVLMEAVSEHVQAAGQFCWLTFPTYFQQLRTALAKRAHFAASLHWRMPGKNEPAV
jgi:hypothetical protein